MTLENLEVVMWVIIAGWSMNWAMTLVSFANDLWWGNMQISQGFIACAAFSWFPFLVFFAGIRHFFNWLIYERSS